MWALGSRRKAPRMRGASSAEYRAAIRRVGERAVRQVEVPTDPQASILPDRAAVVPPEGGVVVLRQPPGQAHGEQVGRLARLWRADLGQRVLGQQARAV